MFLRNKIIIDHIIVKDLAQKGCILVEILTKIIVTATANQIVFDGVKNSLMCRKYGYEYDGKKHGHF